MAVLSRGYGGAGGRNDEALVLEENLPDVPHLQGADRTGLAHIAIEAEMVPLRNTIIIPHVGDAFGPDGQPSDTRTSAAAKILLDDLAWWAAALKQARAQGTLPPAIMRLMAANEGPAKE